MASIIYHQVDLLQGEIVTDPQQIAVLYQLGDFKYQITSSKRTYPIKTCASPGVHDALMQSVHNKLKVVVQVPRR